MRAFIPALLTVPVKKIIWITGLAIVTGVNAFVHLCDSSLSKEFGFGFSHFIAHASEEHAVNRSPFDLSIQWVKANLQIEKAPVIPAPSGSFFFAILSSQAALTCFLFVACLSRGEEAKRIQLFALVISPPPEHR